VDTQDVWTLNVGGGFGRKGGVNSTHLLLQDTNFLGLGKSLTLQRESSVDRTTTLFRYDDHAVLGSRVNLGLSYSANSDGDLRRIDLEQPFYSLDTRWSAGLSAASEDRVDSLYTLGHVSDRFRRREDLLEVRGGLSQGLVHGRTQRWSAGFTFLRDRFSPGAGIEAPTLLPADHTLSYPWIGFESVEDRYREAHNVNRLHRTEDFYLGTQYQARLGYSSSLFGADRQGAVFDGSAGKGFRFRGDQTLLVSSDLAGLWGSGGLVNTRLGGAVQYYWRDFGEELLYASVSGDIARHLDPENQLLLGGDNGLRGYPLRYQAGDGRLLLTLEQRFYTNLYPFRLFHVGAAAFFDAGRVWAGDSSPQEAELGWLRDAGVGLRLSSSRTGLGTVVHLDLAFPLDGDPSIQSMQYLVTTSTSF
jgi:outer membrane protein assembly factor BamA